MEYLDLKLEQTDHVLKIIVNRPEVLNAQSRIMREELDDAFQNAASDDSVRVVIISGSGNHFLLDMTLGALKN